MLIDSFKVTAATVDITDLVMGMTFFESINGLLKGNIQMLDGVNFFDKVIGGHDKLIPVSIEVTYLRERIEIIFMIDGINQMKIFKSEKSYVMHLISLEEFNLKLVDVNGVYNGTANEVLEGIYVNTTGENNRLIVNTISTTKGKYVVPNIPAIEAIANVTYVAIDVERSGFYFYQRLYDEGACRFASLYSMSKDFHKVDGNIFKIQNIDISLDELDKQEIMAEGTASVFELEEYRMNHSDKVQRGEYGHRIHHVELDKTNLKKNEPIFKNQTEIVTTRHKLSELLYGRTLIESRGPHGEPVEYEQKSLFAEVDSPNTQAAVNLRKRIYNNTINVSGMVPSLNLGAGKSVTLALGTYNDLMPTSDGTYIVADLNHIFSRIDDGGGMDYIQNVKLLREYA